MLKDGINEIKIESYDEIVNIICGKHEKNKIDLREDMYSEDYQILNMN